MVAKYALIIANTQYTDSGLAQLKAPGQDAKEFWRVLSSPEICAFDDVNMLLNEDSYRVEEQIEIFFERRKPEDLLLLFFSGHGVKDENGALYLAMRNTNRRRLRSTAIDANFIRSVMDECRSRRQVLILDCCNSGAFAQGTKAETGGSVGTATAFKGTGYGRIILTASDSTQFAWEGDKVIGETENSLFTHFLIKGLEGEADRSGEGRITLDDLYDYAYEQIVSITPKQTPGKWSFKQQGEILLREHMRIEDVTPLPLPPDLVEEIEDKRPYVREAALQRLIKLIQGRNLRLARSAREAVERMAENDDSRTISRMAFQALEAIKQADANAAQLQAADAEAERLAKQQTEAERLARIEAERKAREETERLARLQSERKAKEEADRLAARQAEAERLAKLEAERKAREEAERLARLEVERQAKEEAARLVAQKAEAERLAKLEAERKVREEAERKAKAEADRLSAEKAEAERVARLEAERKAKEEAARLAAQKAEAERLAKQKAEEERLARLEAQRKAKEEADRLAAQKAEADRLARQKAAEERAARAQARRQAQEKVLTDAKARVATLLAAFPAKMPASRAVMFGVAAVAALVLGGFAIWSMMSPGATPATEAPVIQSTVPSTPTPQAPLSTSVPETPTADEIITVTGPALEVGSTYSYADGTVLVAVPAGEFTMGSGGNDTLEHNVTLKDYWIYSTEVTNQQYALCVNLGVCDTPDLDDNPGYANYRLANDPVTGVTYEQAANYCQFVNGRLPTEAEWEKAAQSSQGGIYPWGRAEPSCDFLNFNNCLEGRVASVIDYARGASHYGALNMAGNVFEWVADWYDADYYANSPAENPPGPESGTARVVRSSSYESEAGLVAVANRNEAEPESHRQDLGFRCVVDDPTYFAPFCEAPAVYAGAATQDALATCPDLQIKPVPICSSGIPFTNVTFVGPDGSTIDPKDCLPSSNPNLYTCKVNGTVVSISADCQLNELGNISCPSGYSQDGNLCVPDVGESQTAGNCLAGNYNATGQCCALPNDPSAALRACPVGTYYAANANACLPQPVQELVTVSLEVSVETSCSVPSTGGGGGGGGGGVTTGGGSCQPQSCPEFYSWDSGSCSCKPNN